MPEEDPLKSNREELEKCLEFDYGQKQNMSWLQRIGVFKYKSNTKLEEELEKELFEHKEISQEKLVEFMKDKDRLNLFDQSSTEFKRKLGRTMRVM